MMDNQEARRISIIEQTLEGKFNNFRLLLLFQLNQILVNVANICQSYWKVWFNKK